MKLFFALWPPAEAARALGEWANEVRGQTGGRATAPATIHLTLAFLGEADPRGAVAAVRGVHGKTFSLPVNASRYWRHNRIVWVGPAIMPGPLKQLADDLRRALLLQKFAMEDREFAAHVTLIRKADPPQSLPPPPDIEWPAREFFLVCSVPDKRGSHYETIERFSLA